VTDITMPKLSDSMEEGTILTWLKQDGDGIAVGEDLVEIETDKATITYAAEASGVLSIIAHEGATLAVGAAIARLGERTPVGDKPVPVPEAAPVANPAPVASNGHAAIAAPGDGAVKATPLARRVARAHGVALDDVVGTGPLGRVTRGDVLAKAGLSSPPVTVSAGRPIEPPAAESAKGVTESFSLTRVQATIARRTAETKATVPEFQVETDAAMDLTIEFRAQLKETGEKVPSLNDLIVKAVALALRRHPRANGAYRDGRFELYSRVNVGVAVAADEALVVPTVFDADQKSLGAIAAETRRLTEQVREGKITPAELSGATFTVSNLGMYGMTAITPVINAGQAAILGVGTVRSVLTRVGGEIVERALMTLRLSCDHRILYGADAAQFLSEIRGFLEQPLRLTL
jgi:pyruvate dehydrogenase E2 component (dihydrolipoamide acetyltransferase)